MSCGFLEACTATLSDIMEMESTIVVCVTSVSWSICKANISHTHVHVMPSYRSLRQIIVISKLYWTLTDRMHGGGRLPVGCTQKLCSYA